MNNSENVEIQVYWTNKIQSKEIKDFIQTHDSVFGGSFTKKKFETKFLKNIYGLSIIVLAYVDRKCVGARAFWRNDLDEVLSYQPTDSAVLKEYRGLGIFSNMTRAALDELSDTEYVYNYPNDNSIGAYKRLGWIVVDHKKYKLFNPLKDFNEIEKIDPIYLEWMLSSENNNLYYAIRKGVYYLVYKRKYNLYLVVSKINKKDIKFLKKARFPILLIYSKEGQFGRGIVTTTKNIPQDKKIPIHKRDTLF